MSESKEDESINNHCPGIDSENAGKSSACSGCPNQQICSSGQSRMPNIENDLAEISKRLKFIKHIIIVMSGKGGVGKSTVTSQLARYLASDTSINVGVLDLDICGPSIPKAMGAQNREVVSSYFGWSPIYIEENLSIMSCEFLLESLDDAVIWRGPKKNALIKRFLCDVNWGDLDFLLIDTPPGTSDEHLSLTSFLKDCKNVRGTILVTTPQEIAKMDVRKQIEFCRKVNLPILGYVENMAYFICPECHQHNQIFHESESNFEEKFRIKLLGKIPIDSIIGKSCDDGESIFQNESLSPQTREAFNQIWDNIQNELKTS